MGRGVSSGGGQSSLGYLFGSGEAPKPGTNNSQAAPAEAPAVSKPGPAPEPVDISKQIPAGINSISANNYMRADGQNTCNFLTLVVVVLLIQSNEFSRLGAQTSNSAELEVSLNGLDWVKILFQKLLIDLPPRFILPLEADLLWTTYLVDLEVVNEIVP
ncbi:hypothetical protein GOBAR_AA31259 [Gossypium barbadense]|uniref:Protein SPIRAL1-like 1 n=1 Tax=Gossypium barbadense TaxID=3634 RepID=A0A2P5WEB5_GOSBA|nr:hypothetical protein GOBAR_AA31259 [Gossypium barbadense]